jgi:hypothetical protein
VWMVVSGRRMLMRLLMGMRYDIYPHDIHAQCV